MIKNPAVFVIYDQEGRIGPSLRTNPDVVVHLSNELLAGLHIMVGMLVAGDFLAFIAVVIAVVRFHERIIR